MKKLDIPGIGPISGMVAVDKKEGKLGVGFYKQILFLGSADGVCHYHDYLELNPFYYFRTKDK